MGHFTVHNYFVGPHAEFHCSCVTECHSCASAVTHLTLYLHDKKNKTSPSIIYEHEKWPALHYLTIHKYHPLCLEDKEYTNPKIK